MFLYHFFFFLLFIYNFEIYLGVKGLSYFIHHQTHNLSNVKSSLAILDEESSSGVH